VCVKGSQEECEYGSGISLKSIKYIIFIIHEFIFISVQTP